MSWLQLRLDTAPEQVPQLEELLLAAGAVAVTLEDNADQPLLEPAVGAVPLWTHTRVTGLFTADADIEAVVASLPPAVRQQCSARSEILEDKDWEREWMASYQPMQFGRRLWVCPSWREPPDPSAINLLLDPGLAFGTGTHPTTALCLEQLDGLVAPGQSVVDYGCGSGILAVAALKLGATRALGVDNDPQALLASRDNARRNQLPDQQLELSLPEQLNLEMWSGRADIVVANILAGPLLSLADTLLQLLRPGGDLLLSGLLEHQAEALCSQYAKRIDLCVTSVRDDWVCLHGKLSAT